MPEQRITDAELAKLKELETKATPGEWSQDHRQGHDGNYRTEVFDSKGEVIATLAWHAVPAHRGYTTDRGENAEFIAATRNHLPALIAEIEAKRQQAQCGREIEWK